MKGMLIALITATILNSGYVNEEIYPHVGIVSEINTNTDTVIFTDFNGMEWQFNGVEDWMINDICACIMYNNGTEIINDDKILKVEYKGYVEEVC